MSLLAAALDLVLPSDCLGCGEPFAVRGLCPACTPRYSPFAARPTPAPPGLPACVAAASYEGLTRELVLEYKERGRRGLAAPLGDALALAVHAGAGGAVSGWPLVLVPVPGTAASVRARHGDHMLRLARRAARRLRGEGWAVSIARPLRALPKPDSAHLDRAARAAAAEHAFQPRRLRRGRMVDATVVVVDDVLTTGATLAAVARWLQRLGAPAAFAATVAATRLRAMSPFR